jgi:hypothetical protein
MKNDQDQEGFVGKMEETTGPAAPMGEQLVAQGATIVKLENQTQMTVAVQRPRDEVKILAAALKELDTYPSMADEVLYRKPVGKENGVQKYAEGLSIRTAESLANRWCNSAFGCDIIHDDEQGVILAAVFLDYESNTRRVLQKKVSRMYKASQSAGGGMKRTPDDRFYDVVVPANQSKLLREVILRSLPAGLKLEYENRARQIMLGGDAKKLTTKLVQGFIRLGVSKSKLEELAGKRIDDLTPEEIANLIATGNAIREGETTIEQLIVEKSASEKLTERMTAAGKEAPKGPDADKKPETEAKTTPTDPVPASAATSGGLTGPKLALYEAVAEMAAGDLLEMNAVLAKLSGGVIKDKETLIKADDAMVASVAKKVSSKKG